MIKLIVHAIMKYVEMVFLLLMRNVILAIVHTYLDVLVAVLFKMDIHVIEYSTKHLRLINVLNAKMIVENVNIVIHQFVDLVMMDIN